MLVSQKLCTVAVVLTLLFSVGCGDDDDSAPTNQGGSGQGAAGSGGSGANGASAGAGGSSGTGGTAGSSGSNQGGSSGSAGTGGSGAVSGSSGSGGTAGTGAQAGSSGTAGAGGTAQSVTDWLLEKQHFGFVHGNYGKGSYCGAFEMGAIPGFEQVRCTDTGSYIFSQNNDGTLRMEESVYVYRISEPNPDGTFPWFVDGGYSGSIYWKLTPTEPALELVDPSEAIEFDAIADGGTGPDPYWSDFGASGTQFRTILARGNEDDSLLEWTTADYDPDAMTWTDRATGKLFPGWFIDLYPEGAFYTVICTDAEKQAGATPDDGMGGTFPPGPGYCAPKCRGATDNDPNGANGLPVCEGDNMAERPRADALLPAP